MRSGLHLLLAALLVAACSSAPVGGGPTGRRPGPAPMDDPGPAPDPFPRGDSGPPIDAGLHECASATVAAETTVRPIDVVWVIDSSGSMDNEAALVQENMNRFAADILAEGIDPRVVVITSSDFVRVPAPLGTDPLHYLFIDDHVGSNEPLEKLVEHHARYAPFLRPEAATHFVAVTDDESELSADMFDTVITGLLGHGYTLHAIASEDLGGGRECDGAAAVGAQYWSLAMRTGGERISICTMDWTTVFDRLRTAILETAPLPCSFAMPTPPDGMTLDVARVNVLYTASDGTEHLLPRVESAAACGTRGWYYDHPTTPTQIHLCEGTCALVSADPSGRVDIALGCEAVLL